MKYPLSTTRKLFLFPFLFLAFQFIASAQNISLIVSSIGEQEIFEGARIEVVFSTFKYVDTCSFSSSNLPSFGQLENMGKGYGKFIFEPTANDIGSFDVTLNASKDNAFSSQTFKLIVKNIPDDAPVFYCDPANGNMDNNGDKDHPFGTLKDVVNSNFNIPAGAIFFLRDGNHGRPVFAGANKEMVNILAEAGHQPFIEQISMPFTNNWTIQGIKISPEAANITRKDTYVNIFSGSHDIVIQNCEIFAKKDISDWTTNQHWYDAAGDGIICAGRNCTFKNNYIYNTWFPIQIFPSAVNNLVAHNIVDYFGADAVRGLSSHTQFNYNQIKNAIVDDYLTGNHDDAFQSWTNTSKFPPVVGIVIRGNQITDINDPNLPLPTSVMQGIIDFDGFVEDWIIEDNLVVQHHPHGIALYGAKNCRIANNTIVRNPLNIHSPGDHPWIRINKTKGPEFYLSTGNLTRNNIMGVSVQDEYPGSFDHNLVSKNYADIFVDYENWDFHLKNNANTVDAGIKEGASTIDLDLNLRTDENPDLGCFELNANVTDLENPEMTDISISNINSTSALFNWDQASDVNGIKQYLIRFDDDNPALSVQSPESFLTNLSDETTYQVEIVAVDMANHVSSTQTIDLLTPEYNYQLDTLFCAADYHDVEINSDKKMEWTRALQQKIGNVNSLGTVGVFPFRLPAIPLNAKIINVEIDFNLEAINGSPEGNIDFYGMGSRGDADVKTTDFWQGPFDHETAKGHSLIDDLITLNSAIGKISTGKNPKLTKFIKDQYEQNSNPGDFIFFRLNNDVINENQNAFYQISSANSGKSINAPLLKIYTEKAVATSNVTNAETFNIYPNPLTKNQNFKISIDEQVDTRNANIKIWNATGNLIYSNPFVNGDLISSAIFQQSGLFIIKIDTRDKTFTSKIILD